VADVGGQGDDADAADDGRARSPDADAADRGILSGAEDARRAGQAPAVPGGVPRHGVEAVELPPDAAVHDELVQPVDAANRRARDPPAPPRAAAVGGPGSRRPQHLYMRRILTAMVGAMLVSGIALHAQQPPPPAAAVTVIRAGRLLDP